YKLKHDVTGAVRRGEPVIKSTLVLDPLTEPKMKAYFDARLKGFPRAVAAAKAKIRKPMSSLISIERNALVYAGHTVWNKHGDGGVTAERFKPREEWVIQRDTHEALITTQDAERLMKMAMPEAGKAQRRGGPSGRYLLTGLLFTPDGLPMVGTDKI